MLFYTQIKRQFSHISWKRGQMYFREERVRDVKLAGDLLSGKVQGTDKSAYETAIVMARGTIQNSKCSCPAHRVYETHCKHVAALAIWVVERGSLLRAGVSEGEFGVAPGENEIVVKNGERAIADVRLRKLLQAHPEILHSRCVIRRERMSGTLLGRGPDGRSFSVPVTLVEAAALLEYSEAAVEAIEVKPVFGDPILYVRGIMHGKSLSAVTVESGIRYMDPESGTPQINTLTYLRRQDAPGQWKTNQGVLLQVPPAPQQGDIAYDPDIGPILNLAMSQVIYQGQAALDQLAQLLTHPGYDRIVFDRTLNVKVERSPLKLVSMKINSRGDQSRALSYEFEGENLKLSSEELAELAKLGRLSSQFVWKDDTIYRFETSLQKIAQYANRSGVAAAEGPAGQPEGNEGPLPVDGFGALHDSQEHPLHPIAVYRLSLELGVKNLSVDEQWSEFHAWKKNFEKSRIPALPKVTYGFKLRAYQRNGLSWLWSLYHRGLGALLADEMGLGKTHQVLAFLTSLYKPKKKPKKPSLVVAPTSVIAAWEQKLTKYKTGLKYHVFHGAGRKLPASGVDVILTTYGILQREAVLRDREWHVVILDEAQAIKNGATLSARAARSLKAQFRIAMTGTPVENQATDLWSLMEFLLPGYLGSLTRFKRLYVFGREIPSPEQAETLRRLTSTFLLRRTKAQVLKELPEKTEEVISCEMTDLQKKAYRAFLQSADAAKAREDLKGGGKIDYANILSILTRLKQVCDHPKLPSLSADSEGDKAKKGRAARTMDPAESGKWEACQELLSEALGSSLKVVVFTQYLGMMDLIGHYLEEQGIGYTDLRGDTTDRAERLHRFQNDPECRVFVCSLLAGGLGIDLTAASVCIHYDRWWNPAKENQATDRLHRFGQTRGVQVFKLQIPGTVEDRIASIIQSKVALSGALIEESSAGLKSFSRKDLLELLTASPD